MEAACLCPLYIYAFKNRPPTVQLLEGVTYAGDKILPVLVCLTLSFCLYVCCGCVRVAVGTEKLQFDFSEGNVGVLSCFFSHLAFQWVALSFNKVLSIQTHPCWCWKGDGKHGFFRDILCDPCTTKRPVDARCICSSEAEPSGQNYPHLLSVFCSLKFLNWLPEETVPAVWELHELQLRKNPGCNYLLPAPPSRLDLEAVITCSELVVR